jgi:hypothetical protein
MVEYLNIVPATGLSVQMIARVMNLDGFFMANVLVVYGNGSLACI